MTNKLTTRDVEEFLADYTPSYSPIMPLLMKNSQVYDVEQGSVSFKRAEAIGDLRSKRIGPKDTEWKQILAGQSKKSFKKYFMGSQFIQSTLQNREGFETIISQALDEHNKQQDELMLTGGGTDNASVLNAGLFFSNDSNYVTETSHEVALADGLHLDDLYAKMVEVYENADELDGEKLIMPYGADLLGKFNSLFKETKTPFSRVLRDAIQASIAKMPASVTPSGNGFIVINLDHIKLHYTTFAKIDDQGTNAEKKYVWTNFLMGSTMVECLTRKAIVHQPLTFES